MLQLIEGDRKYLKDYQEAYIMSMDKVISGELKLRNLMFDNPLEVDIIKKMIDDRDEKKLKRGYVPSFDYFIVDDDKFIGRINIRTRLNPSLLHYSGNIGYGIHPKYWKMGYGSDALRLGLLKAKELGLKDKVLLTCDDDNIGSYKIIEKNGGILENKIEVNDENGAFLVRRYWIKL